MESVSKKGITYEQAKQILRESKDLHTLFLTIFLTMV